MAVVVKVADGERGVGQNDRVRQQQCIVSTNVAHDLNAASSVVLKVMFPFIWRQTRIGEQDFAHTV